MFTDPDRTRLLAICPHLDDAVLSLGAGLAQAVQDGATVTVFTVFAGSAVPPYSPAAERMHEIWGFAPHDDAPLYRRKEDVAALDHLGAGHRHGRFLDSIYRTLPDGRWLADRREGREKLAIPEQSPESNRELVSAIRAEVDAMIEEYDPTVIATCAAIGKHPDHEMARDAALLAAAGKDLPVRLWEDLPYALFRPDTVELPRGFRLGPPDFGAVKAEKWTRKREALAHYVSQMSMFNGPDRDLFAQLESYARSVSPQDEYGETTWPVTCHER
jgi:LmbE family N-acetylglucosaminyl deacetylase